MPAANDIFQPRTRVDGVWTGGYIIVSLFFMRAICYFVLMSCCRMTAEPIADSIWLTGGTLLVGTGNQMLQYGVLRHLPLSTQESKYSGPGLFEAVARMNGPLPQYHPQMILQCLLWGKVELVKEIVVRLATALDLKDSADTEIDLDWDEIPVDVFLMKEQTSAPSVCPIARA